MSEDEFEIDDVPTSIDPYATLSIPHDATQETIKKAYRKAAMKHHPDKAAESDKATAHARFQEIAFAFAILSDERRRRRYDTTGRTEDTLDLDDDDFDWASFYRAQFASAVTEATINKFADEYRHGAEEHAAVLKAYTRHKGDMNRLYNEVMLSDMVEDETRYRAIIDEAIAAGTVESFSKYTDESEATRNRRIDRHRKRKEIEAREAEQTSLNPATADDDEEEDETPDLDSATSKSGKKKKPSSNKKASSSTPDLAALIQQRQRGREHAQDDFFARLEAKYAAPSGKGGGKKRQPVDEPDEEAFARNAKKPSRSRAEHAADSAPAPSRKSQRGKK